MPRGSKQQFRAIIIHIQEKPKGLLQPGTHLSVHPKESESPHKTQVFPNSDVNVVDSAELH